MVAYHGMSFSIFPKFLENPEDFRKNPYVKIPSKSPSTNFQSLPKIQIPNKIQKDFISWTLAQLQFSPLPRPLPFLPQPAHPPH
jgi:hypothetical protein